MSENHAIHLEDPNVKGMAQLGNSGLSVADGGLGEFMVSESKTSSTCAYVNHDLTLKDQQ